MSIDDTQLSAVIGKTVFGVDGSKIGKVGQFYLDDVTGKLEWVTVQIGKVGGKENFVPVAQSEVTDDGLTVPFDKDIVQEAPQVDPDAGHITPDEEAMLYRHYGMDYSQGYPDSGLPDGRSGRQETESGLRETEGYDTSGPTTDDAMTRSEEHLEVGTRRQQAGQARLRKYVVTEQQNISVPVSREEVRLEREPITESNRGDAMSGPDISEEEYEITLEKEEVVVEKKATPVERVKLSKDTVTDEQQVTEQVRKEQIEMDTPDRGTDLDEDER